MPEPDAPAFPNVVSIAAGAPFLEHLADRLLDGTLCAGPSQRPASPLPLEQASVLLPNRRAARTFRNTLVARAGRPLLLPRITAIGDVDEDETLLAETTADGLADVFAAGELPPAATALERQLALTRLVIAFGERGTLNPVLPDRDEALRVPSSAVEAVALARDLAGLLDSLATEEIGADAFNDLVPDNHAAYWDLAHQFVKIVVEHWPAFLHERGLADPIARRNMLIRRHAEQLAAEPPQTPCIVAGSTGSVPATAALMAAVARLPRGWVVLPGLDRLLDDASWAAIGDKHDPQPSHPQFGLARLIGALGVSRRDVGTLTGDAPVDQARGQLVSEVFRPTATTECWHDAAKKLDLEAGTEGLSVVLSPTPRVEALAIALALREAVETGLDDAALVTPDRGLARRVAGELKRWRIDVDDSAGRPLSGTSAGAFVRIVAEAATGNLAPAALADLIGHTLFGCLDQESVDDAVAAFRTLCLHGPPPAPGFPGLRSRLDTALSQDPIRHPVSARLARHGDAARGLIDALDAALTPLMAMAGGDVGFRDYVDALRKAAEALSRQDGDEVLLYAGEDGAALQRLFEALSTSDDAGIALRPEACAGLLRALMAGVTVRPTRRDRRIVILGPLEARLQRFGRVVLGGLNEGAWPAEPKTDPWLSRAMRAKAGLDQPERRIGLAAHDVAQAMAGGDVILTRSLKQDGAPSVASRWLQRLQAVAGPERFDELAARGQRYLDWAEALDAAEPGEAPREPAPKPPFDKRPRRLSVTQAETLVRDPYAIHARHILKLEPLPAIGEAADAALRGTLVHAALAEVVAGDAAPDAARLMAAFENLMQEQALPAHTRALWRPRLERIAAWFADDEAERRAAAPDAAHALEVSGELSFEALGGAFKLAARADRIDCGPDGRLLIIDYKTGALPTGDQVASGLAPQMTLEGAIARAGGFRDVPAGLLSGLRYIRLSGGDPAGQTREVGGDAPDALADEALAGFRELIAAYDDPDMAYRPRIAAKLNRDEETYDHLSRFREWSAVTGEDDAS